MEKKKEREGWEERLANSTLGLERDIHWFKFIPTSEAELKKDVVYTEVAVSSGGIIFIPASMLCATVFVMQAIMEDREMYLEAEDGYYVPLEWARLNFPVLAAVFDSVDELMHDHVRDILSRITPVPPSTVH